MNCILTKSRYWYLPGNLHKCVLGSEWQQPKGQGKRGSSQRGTAKGAGPKGIAKGASDQRGMAKGAQPKGLPLALKLEAI